MAADNEIEKIVKMVAQHINIQRLYKMGGLKHREYNETYLERPI